MTVVFFHSPQNDVYQKLSTKVHFVSLIVYCECVLSAIGIAREWRERMKRLLSFLFNDGIQKIVARANFPNLTLNSEVSMPRGFLSF